MTHVLDPLRWTPPDGTAGLIFDCDGTIADTMPVHFQAWKSMLGKYGITFSEKRFYELGGVPTEKIIHVLSDESGIPVKNVSAMVNEKEGYFLDHLHLVQPLKSVIAIAERYRGALPMAVASGGYRDTITRTLDQIGIRSWFNALVVAEDTSRHKPEPDVFLEAARRIAVDPRLCVVFEDTDIGLEAARRAQMHSVDVRPWVGRVVHE